MIEVTYKPTFVRQFDALDENLQEEVLEKIKLFRDRRNHKQLKVHKLHGHLSKQWGFSVNYKIRIVFSYTLKSEVILLSVGSHQVYN